MRKYLVTGDTHGKDVLTRLRNVDGDSYALIILGDAGFNFYLNKTDNNLKKQVNDMNVLIYCVRGNHEERPENIAGMEKYFDEEIDGFVYLQEQFPNIRYLMDGETYEFEGHKTLVIGGAYSVDKYYRLAYYPKSAKWTGWFEGEQLTPQEMVEISDLTAGNTYDIVLTHTCPESWQPTDLFLSGLKQSTVDKTMEVWLEKVKNNITFNLWLFGHFHDDRFVRPHVEMLFTNVQLLEDIYNRWNSGKELPWSYNYDPKFEEGI